jgi:hydroxypyruvate isomerase
MGNFVPHIGTRTEFTAIVGPRLVPVAAETSPTPDLRFSANLSLLFRELPFLERFEAAARSGFDAVEFWWPDGEDLSAVEAAVADASVQVVMMNFYAGDMAAGDRGLMADPDRQGEFWSNVPVALGLAGRLGCKQLNALVGGRLEQISRDDQLSLARDNLAGAARDAKAAGVGVLVEAVNTVDNDAGYLISRTTDAVTFIKSVEADNVGLLHDLYHMQRMEGNLTATLREYFSWIRHIHVADSPGRNEPGTGEINYPFVFAAIADTAFTGYVGLEYRASTPASEDSFGWLDAWRQAA